MLEILLLMSFTSHHQSQCSEIVLFASAELFLPYIQSCWSRLLFVYPLSLCVFLDIRTTEIHPGDKMPTPSPNSTGLCSLPGWPLSSFSRYQTALQHIVFLWLLEKCRLTSNPPPHPEIDKSCDLLKGKKWPFWSGSRCEFSVLVKKKKIIFKNLLFIFFTY